MDITVKSAAKRVTDGWIRYSPSLTWGDIESLVSDGAGLYYMGGFTEELCDRYQAAGLLVVGKNEDEAKETLRLVFGVTDPYVYCWIAPLAT